MRIQSLTAATALTSADQFPLASNGNGDTLRTSLSLLLAYMQENINIAGGESVQQYAAPSTTGFNITVLAPDTWLIITPVTPLATGTITLPSVRDNQQWVQVSTSNTISALTVVGSGASVVGAPVGLLVGGFFTMAYDETTNVWYRVA